MEEPSAIVQDPIPTPPLLSLRPIHLTLVLIFSILIGVGGYAGYREYASAPVVSTTYEECIKARRSIIQESYPATCVTRDGKRFIQPTITDPLSCTTDDDCTTGIQTSGCCSCPKAINKSEIGKDNWEPYIFGKDYSNKSTCKTFMACKPCESPTQPTCQENLCIFPSDTSVNEPDSIPSLSVQEKTTGWYWGTKNQKKSGTPDEWLFTEAGKSSCWHKPTIPCL